VCIVIVKWHSVCTVQYREAMIVCNVQYSVALFVCTV